MPRDPAQLPPRASVSPEDRNRHLVVHLLLTGRLSTSRTAARLRASQPETEEGPLPPEHAR